MNIESHEGNLKEKSKIELFREQFGELIRQEKEKMGSGKDYNPHLIKINIEELTDEDAEIWEKYINRALTFGELFGFRKNVISRAEKRTEKDIPTPDDLAVLEKHRKGEITRDEFLDYWQKTESNIEFLDYWREKMTDAGEREKFGDSEENYYAYLDNKIAGDRYWMKKFAEEGKNKKEQRTA